MIEKSEPTPQHRLCKEIEHGCIFAGEGRHYAYKSRFLKDRANRINTHILKWDLASHTRKAGNLIIVSP